MDYLYRYLDYLPPIGPWEMTAVPSPSQDLDQEQREQFHEKGYVFTPGFLPGETIETLRHEANDLLEILVNVSLARGENIRLSLVQPPDGERQSLRKVQPYLDLSSTFFDFATSDGILEPLRQLYDDEPVLHVPSSKINYKQPLPEPIEGLEYSKRTDRFPIHSDWGYYKRNDYPQEVTTTIVFLDDVKEDSGPLQIWPGTHTEELEHESIDIGRQVVPGELEGYESETLLGPAGSVLTFDSRLVHSSSPNESDRPRKFAIFTHYPESNETDAFRVNSSVDYVNAEARQTGAVVEYLRQRAAGEVEDQWRLPQR